MKREGQCLLTDVACGADKIAGESDFTPRELLPAVQLIPPVKEAVTWNHQTVHQYPLNPHKQE